MTDFTIIAFRRLLDALSTSGYSFKTFENFLANPGDKAIILRHDVDDLPANALKIARLENQLQIEGTFFFRIHKNKFDIEIIKEIASLGHEIGYHYEDMDLASNLSPIGTHQVDLYDLAWSLFRKHLAALREITPVTTISMHGSPLSKFDNKVLWEKFDFRELGIIGEPYLDINFDEVAYFTDTGRRWNGVDVSIRDKVYSRFNFNFRTTQQLIHHMDQLPDKIMFTFHPQRWNDEPWLWTKELIWQNIKNIGKFALLKIRK